MQLRNRNTKSGFNKIHFEITKIPIEVWTLFAKNLSYSEYFKLRASSKYLMNIPIIANLYQEPFMESVLYFHNLYNLSSDFADNMHRHDNDGGIQKVTYEECNQCWDEDGIKTLHPSYALAISNFKLDLSHPSTQVTQDLFDFSLKLRFNSLTLEILQLARIDIDPSNVSNLAIRNASTDGCLELTKILLKDERVIPEQFAVIGYFDIEVGDLNFQVSCVSSIALAAESGHLHLVQYLLEQTDRIDPTSDNCGAIRIAALNGRVDCVALLLGDERIDPSLLDNDALGGASFRGHDKVVDLLLTDARVDPSADSNCALAVSSRNGHLKVVKRLLQDERVDPTANNNTALRMAAENGHLQVVQELIYSGKINDVTESFVIATENQHFEIAEFLAEFLNFSDNDNDNDCQSSCDGCGCMHSP